MERLKVDLQRCYDWTVRGAFETVDICNEGYLSEESIRRFLLVNSYNPTQQELDAIIRRLDADCDYRLSF